MADSPLVTQSSLAPPKSPYSDAFLKADAYVAYQEGGKTADDGLGNPTAFGINQNAHKNVNVMDLTPREAQAIRYTYWQAINGDGWAKLDPRTALIGYDTAIMSNPNLAYKLLEKSKGDPAAMYALRSQTINELAQNPKYANAANNWRSRTQDLGQTIGVVPGAPRTPPVEKLMGTDTVYVPAGYNADTSTQVPVSGRLAYNNLLPGVAQTEPQPTPTPTPTPEKPTNPLQEGLSGALKAETKAPETPAIPVTKPTVALPQGPISPDRTELYAKALEKIANRDKGLLAQASPAAGSPVAQQETYQEKVAKETQAAPKQEQPTQNDETA